MNASTAARTLKTAPKSAPTATRNNGSPGRLKQGRRKHLCIRLYNQPETPMIWFRSIIVSGCSIGLADMANGVLLRHHPQYSDIFWKYRWSRLRWGFSASWLIRAGFAFCALRLRTITKAVGLFFGYRAAGLLIPLLLWLAIPNAAGIRIEIFIGLQTYTPRLHL